MSAMTLRSRLIPVLLVCAATACGEVLVDGHYRGEPLLVLSGRVVEALVPGEPGGPVAPHAQDIQVALFWARSPDGPSETLEAVSAVEQQVQAAAMILRYEVRVYTPPPAEVLTRPYKGQGKIALGLVIAYVDVDRSGSWDPDKDQLVGGVPERVVVYTPTGVSGPMFDDPLPAGFHVMASAPCAEDEHVMRLGPAPDDEPTLMVNLDVEASLYLDLNCDGKPEEWYPAGCPPPWELEPLCADPEMPPEQQETCDFCSGFLPFDECAPLIDACPELPPELCVEYQLCLDPGWVLPPHLICDHEMMLCHEENPGDPMCDEAFPECLQREECLQARTFCLDEGNPPDECETAFEVCMAEPW